MKPVLIVVASVLLLAGCSSAPAPAAPTSASFTFGASATAIASAVKACDGVQEETLASTAVGISSLASCKIAGKQVDFYSWTSASSQGDPAHQFKGLGVEVYYAAAVGWTAIAHEDGDLPGQQSVAQAVVESLDGKVTHVTP